MYKFFVDDINDGLITGEEYNHLSRVLRLAVGDHVLCFDGSDFVYTCELKKIDKTAAYFDILSKDINKCNPKARVTLFQALPKGDKLELIIQKASELGISEIQPYESKYCIAKANAGKLERLNKIAVSACKQCGRGLPLVIHDAVKFDDMLNNLKEYDTVIVAYENEDDKSLYDVELKGRVAIVVGSEGGFAQEEIARLSQYNVVTLGSRILRAETAAIALSAIVMYRLGEMR